MRKKTHKSRISIKGSNYRFVKTRVAEQEGVYRVDISSTHDSLPLDSIICGDALHVLRSLPEGFVDLIVTSPPYADKRTNSYGGIHPDKYVQWFLPISYELKRVLKPSGTFVLNIKEGVAEGQRRISHRNAGMVHKTVHKKWSHSPWPIRLNG